MGKISFYLYALVLSLLFATITEATSTSTENSISGVIKNIKDLPIESAKLKLEGKKTKIKKKTFSDETGFFEFKDLEPDTYKVTAKKKGYMKSKQTVNLGEEEKKEIEIVMEYDLTGKWKGYFETSLVPLTNITLNLKQSGNKIEGNLKGEGGITGKIKGTIDGDTGEFKLKTTTPFCPGRFEGTATISEDGNEMDFTMTGNDCLGKHEDGYGYVNR